MVGLANAGMGLGVTFARNFGDDLQHHPEQFKKIEYAERGCASDHPVIHYPECAHYCVPQIAHQ
jgi:hypothetical protein